MLTASADTGSKFVGTEKGDVFKADSFVSATGTYLPTLNSSDELDGGAGKDTLNITDEATTGYSMASATIKNIETITIKGAKGVTADVSGSNITGLETISVLKSVEAEVHANSTTDVNVSGATGAINVSGGKNIVVTDTGTNNAIVIGQTATVTGVTATNAAGTITVTDSKQGTANITTNGGTDVTINTTISATVATANTGLNGGDISVGALTAATGAVKVTQNLNSDGANSDDDDLTAADITVTGGKTVDVTVNSTITAKDKTAEGDIANGKITVNGDTNTTAVSVKQTSSITKAVATAAVAEVKATETVTFKALVAGDSVTVNGLTFTAAKALTANEVAQAFSNLTKEDKQSELGIDGNGIYTGQNGTAGTTAIWTSGAANGATVVFTGPDATNAATANPTDLVISASVKTPTASYTNATITPATVVVDGTVKVVEAPTANTVTLGLVNIEDKSTAKNTIKTITVDGYSGTSTTPLTTDSNIIATTALETLNLSNAQGAAVMVVADTAETLALTVENLRTAATAVAKGVKKVAKVEAVLTLTAAPLTLNVTSKGNNFVDLKADATTKLNVSGTGLLDVSAKDLAALKTVVVTETAGLSLLAASGDTIESIDTTATTGTVTSTISGIKATYAGGAGNDNLTVSDSATAISKAIDLGNGDNTLTLSGLTGTTPTATIKAGTGTDTLVMTAAAAEDLTADNTFEAKIEGFDRLTIGTAAANEVVNLANMDDINYVTTAGSSAGTAQVATFTINATTTTIGDTFTITVNGKEYSYSTLATNEAVATIAAGLKAAIGDDLGSAITVGGANPVITLTANAKGNAFTASAAQVSVALANSTAVSSANVTGLTLDNMLTGGTVVLTKDGNIKVNVKDAALVTSTADVLNVIAQSNAAATVTSELIANNVETINITTVESYVADVLTGVGVASTQLQTINLTAYEATKVNVIGDDTLTLTTTGATKLVSVDASTMTGTLTYVSTATAAATVKGGLGADHLTSTSANSVLIGNAGNDTLVVNDDTSNKVTLNGGEGKDTYILGSTSNQNSYATITGTASELSGDVIVFADTSTNNNNTIAGFNAAKIDLGTTAVFDSLVNEAAKGSTADHKVSYFTFTDTVAGTTDTYLVQNNSTDATFKAGVDSIVKIAGIVDFTFNSTTNVLEIA